MLEQVGDKTITKLIDFGLFSDVTNKEGNTRGSVDYVSPEMFALPFNEVDVCRSDMWSLAVVLFAMILQEIIEKVLLRKLKPVLFAELLTTQLDNFVRFAIINFINQPRPTIRALCNYLVPLDTLKLACYMTTLPMQPMMYRITRSLCRAD